ncbi:hypothetical protein RhiJN_15144 [Ceratobasidium sp. AG-Ba]|nr:hypothetical protein RhiJN_15144 [Ceratobasidium sp. AG-Ba]
MQNNVVDKLLQGIFALLLPGYRTALIREAELKALDNTMKDIEYYLDSMKKSLELFEPVLRSDMYTMFRAKFATYLRESQGESIHQRICKRRLGPSSREIEQAWIDLKSRETRILEIRDGVRAFHDEVLKACAAAIQYDLAAHESISTSGSPEQAEKPTRPPFMSTPALWCFGPQLLASTLTLAFGSSLLSTFTYGSASCLIRTIVFRDDDHTVIRLACSPPNPRHSIDAEADPDVPPHHPGRRYQLTITLQFPCSETAITLPFDGGMNGVFEDIRECAAFLCAAIKSHTGSGIPRIVDTEYGKRCFSYRKIPKEFNRSLPGANDACCADHAYYSSSTFWRTKFLPVFLGRASVEASAL